MKNYNLEIFEHLILLIRTDSDSERLWLKENNCEELSHLLDAIDNVETSFQWLLKNNYTELAAVVDGLAENSKAKLFLLRNGHPELAAFVEACFGSKTAVAFLLKNNYKGWVMVAKEIFDRDQLKEKKSFWGLFSLGNPFGR